MYHAKAMCAFQLSHPYSVSEPFHSQDHMSNSPYCLLYDSYDVSLDNLVLDYNPKLIFFSILITCLLVTL